MYSIAASRGPPCFTKQTPKQVEHNELVGSSAGDDQFVDHLADESTSNSSSACDFVLPAYDTVSENDLIDDGADDCAHVVENNKASIECNPDDDRCSHTVVPPSSMMKLAMELQVSNRGKASKMYREGKIKAESDSEDDKEEIESKLAGLWVVPAETKPSQEPVVSTATHLQPSLKNADFVIPSSSKCQNIDSSSSEDQSPSKDVTNNQELDVMLSGITAADLVGAPDRTIPEYITEDDLSGKTESSRDKEASSVDTITDIFIQKKVISESVNYDEDGSAGDRKDLKIDEVEQSAKIEKTYLISLNDATTSVLNHSTTGNAKTNDDLQESITPEHNRVETQTIVDHSVSNEVSEIFQNEMACDTEQSKQAIFSGNNDEAGTCPPALDSIEEFNKTPFNDSHETAWNEPVTANKKVEQIDCETVKKTTGVDSSSENKSAADINNNSLGLKYGTADNHIDDFNIISSSVAAQPIVQDLVTITTSEAVADAQSKKNENKKKDKIETSNCDYSSNISTENFSLPSSSFVSVVSKDSATDFARLSTNGASSSPSQMTSNDVNWNNATTNDQGNKNSSSGLSDTSKLLAQTDASLTVNITTEVIEAHSRPKNSTDCRTPVEINASSRLSFAQNNDVNHTSQNEVVDLDDGKSNCDIEEQLDRSEKDTTTENESEAENVRDEIDLTSEFFNSREKVTIVDESIASEAGGLDTETKPETDKSDLSLENDFTLSKDTCLESRETMPLCCCIPNKNKSEKQQSYSKKFFKSKNLNGSDDSIVKDLRVLAKKQFEEKQHLVRKALITDGNLNDPSVEVNAPTYAANDILLDEREDERVIKVVTRENDNDDEIAQQLPQSPNEDIFDHKSSTTSENDQCQNDVALKNDISSTVEKNLSNDSYLGSNCIDISAAEATEQTKNFLEHQNKVTKIHETDVVESEITFYKNSANTNLNNKIVSEQQTTKDVVASVIDSNDIYYQEPVIVDEESISASAVDMQSDTTEEKSFTSSIIETNSRNEGTLELNAEDYSTNAKETIQSNIPGKSSNNDLDIELSASSSTELETNFEEVNSREEMKQSSSNLCTSNELPDELIHEPLVNPTGIQIVLKTTASQSSNEAATTAQNTNKTETRESHNQKNTDLPEKNTSDQSKEAIVKAKPPPIKPKPKRNTQSKQIYSSKTYVDLHSNRKKPEISSSINRSYSSVTAIGNRFGSRFASMRDNNWMRDQKVTRSYTSSSLSRLAKGTVKQRQQMFESEKQSSTDSTTRFNAKPNRIKLTTSASTSLSPSVAGKIRDKFTPASYERSKPKISSFCTRSQSMQWTTKKDMPLFGREARAQDSFKSKKIEEVDEETSGVVDAPTMKVKEIRAKYKTRDYENYAKPRTSSQSSGTLSRQQSMDSEKRRTSSGSTSEISMNETDNPDPVVAQQVMGLFQGALDFEKELAIFEEESAKAYAAFGLSEKPTSKESDSSSRDQEKSQLSSKSENTKPWRPTQPEVFAYKKNDLKASIERIKNETNAVSSFDESLDQFYDVFNDLAM